jgi:hypothetical protein
LIFIKKYDKIYIQDKRKGVFYMNKVYIDAEKDVRNLDALSKDCPRATQVAFIDSGSYDVKGGIYIDYLNGVICGCCGALVPLSDIEFLSVYDDWVDLSECITGGDFDYKNTLIVE